MDSLTQLLRTQEKNKKDGIVVDHRKRMAGFLTPVNIALVVACLVGVVLLVRSTQKPLEFPSIKTLSKFAQSEEQEVYLEMQSLMQSQSEARITELKKLLRPGSNSGLFAVLYNSMVPEVFCPSLLRIGRIGDGGKWMCRPHNLPAGCSIYSLGVNTDTSFERELQTITDKRCKVLSFDKRQVSEKVIANFASFNAKFIRAFISDHDDEENGERSIKKIMQDNGDERIEVLKIDIERSEFSVMPILLENAKMCQILIEIHGSPLKVVELIRKMAEKGFRMFSYEINGYHHHLSEYSFIHDDCLEQYNALPLAYYWDKVK